MCDGSTQGLAEGDDAVAAERPTDIFGGWGGVGIKSKIIIFKDNF